MKTLIIVDVQYDFLPGGSLAVKDGDKIIPVINKLIERFDLIIFTRDYHPKDHKSFASNHEGKNPYDVIDLHGLPQTLWPDHCVQGSRGSEIHEELLNNPALKNKQVYIFKKGLNSEIDSYSGFMDNALFGHESESTGLGEFLQEKGVDEIFVTGLAYDYCVSWTALDASKFGLKTKIILDATKAIDPEFKLRDFIHKNITILESKSI